MAHSVPILYERYPIWVNNTLLVNRAPVLFQNGIWFIVCKIENMVLVMIYVHNRFNISEHNKFVGQFLYLWHHLFDLNFHKVDKTNVFSPWRHTTAVFILLLFVWPLFYLHVLPEVIHLWKPTLLLSKKWNFVYILNLGQTINFGRFSKELPFVLAITPSGQN